MKNVVIEFPTINTLLDYFSVVGHGKLDIIRYTISGELNDADIELAVSGYLASVRDTSGAGNYIEFELA